MAKQTQVVPEVGMGATMGVGSDCYPYTIHKVEGQTLWASEDEYERTDSNGAYTENQDYRYWNNNEKNEKMWRQFTLRKNGRWVRRGSDMHTGSRLSIGHRKAYRSPHF